MLFNFKIKIEYDKWNSVATVNGEYYGKALKVRLYQELEWKGKFYVIVHTEDEVWRHFAIGKEKNEYINSLKTCTL